MARGISRIGFRLAVSRAYRNRYREVITALVRHGFGFLVTQLGLTRALPYRVLALGRRRPEYEAYTQAEHVRLVFEELGTTFIKVGQILSTRVDLLPPDYIHELEKLLDAVPPASPTDIFQTIERDLGRPLNEVFFYIDPVPLASASIGQVHAALLRTGEEVVVKVKRPGVQEQVELDVTIIMELAALANERLPFASNYDFEGIAKEFTQTLLHELDYIHEGRNADRFRELFEDDETVCIPKIFWEHTTNNVIVMERLYGVRINNIRALKAAGLDPVEIAHREANIILKQVFDFGFFHADPHPANFVVREGNTICLLDFGMVGYLDEQTKSGLVEIFLAVYEQDPDAIIDAYIDLGVLGRVERFAELRSDITSLIQQYYGLSIDELDIKSILIDVTSVIRRHNLRMPPNLALLIKTVIMAEGLVKQLDPSFNFAEAMRPFAMRLWQQTYSVQALARRSARALVDYIDLGTRAPDEIRRILGQLSRGELRVIINEPRLDEELGSLNYMINKLVLGILGAAGLIFTGLLLSFYEAFISRRACERQRRIRR